MSGRFVSQSIQVPFFTNPRSRETVAMESEDMDIDEKELRAAEALCELSSSPISLLFSASLPLKPVISPVSSINSIGMREVPSASHLARSHLCTALEPSSVDEGIESDTNRTGFVRPIKNASLAEVFQCTWPGCGWSCDSTADIEKHIRQDHQCGSDSEEELFYYTSKKMASDDDHSLTQAFNHLQASSPPQTLSATTMRPVPDHDYLLKQAAFHSLSSAPQSIPIPRRPLHGPTHHSYQPDSSPLSPTSFSLSPQSRSWQYSSQVGAASPTTVLSASPGHKRSRSDVKKCRKVYGMERRDEWCTQCKWKKACTRFMD